MGFKASVQEPACSAGHVKESDRGQLCGEGAWRECLRADLQCSSSRKLRQGPVYVGMRERGSLSEPTCAAFQANTRGSVYRPGGVSGGEEHVRAGLHCTLNQTPNTVGSNRGPGQTIRLFRLC